MLHCSSLDRGPPAMERPRIDFVHQASDVGAVGINQHFVQSLRAFNETRNRKALRTPRHAAVKANWSTAPVGNAILNHIPIGIKLLIDGLKWTAFGHEWRAQFRIFRLRIDPPDARYCGTPSGKRIEHNLVEIPESALQQQHGFRVWRFDSFDHEREIGKRPRLQSKAGLCGDLGIGPYDRRGPLANTRNSLACNVLLPWGHGNDAADTIIECRLYASPRPSNKAGAIGIIHEVIGYEKQRSRRRRKVFPFIRFDPKIPSGERARVDLAFDQNKSQLWSVHLIRST